MRISTLVSVLIKVDELKIRVRKHMHGGAAPFFSGRTL